jgi:hypothetical protein
MIKPGEKPQVNHAENGRKRKRILCLLFSTVISALSLKTSDRFSAEYHLWSLR